MTETDSDWYRSFVQQLEVEGCMSALPRGCQYRDVTSKELFDCLIPRVPESWDLLMSERLGYVADLKFPLTTGQTGHINRLKFQNGRKEFRTMLFKHVQNKVHQMVLSPYKRLYDHDKVHYISAQLQTAPIQGNEDEDMLTSFIPPELLEKVTNFLTEAEMETIQGQLNELTASYGDQDKLSIISAAQSDPRFEKLRKTFEGIFQGKPDEFSAVFADHADVFEKMQNGGNRMESMLPSMVTRQLAEMTKPEIPDDDPMSLSEAQFEALRKEVLGKQNE